MDDAPGDPKDSDLLGISRAGLVRLFTTAGLKAVHAETAWADIHRRFARSLDEMPRTLPKPLSFLRGAGYRIGTLSVDTGLVSSDGFTRKYLLRLADHARIETVLMHYDHRSTACISTQAGCAMGCVFCATGQAGFTRHLTAGEIVAQVYHAARILGAGGRRLRNIVLMGQGEPLHNFDAVMQAVDILTDEQGLALAAGRVTLSTVGLVPGIRQLSASRLPISLAVSLHGATDAEREALVPIARRWPLPELMDACLDYTRQTGRGIFFEWTLIAGANDSTAHAERLGRLLAGQDAHVNLIPLNPTAGFDGSPTAGAPARAFQETLRDFGIPSTVRQRRGIDIAAGCGQLAGVDP